MRFTVLKSLLTIFFALCLCSAFAQTDSLLQAMIDSAKSQQARKPKPVNPDTQRLVTAPPVKRDSARTIIKRDTAKTVKTVADTFNSSALVNTNPVEDSLKQDTSAVAIIVPHTYKPISWLKDTAFQRLLLVHINNRNIHSLVHDGEVHMPEQKDFLFYTLLGVILLVAVVKQLFPKYFYNIFRLMFQASFRQKQTREMLMQEKLPSLLMNILFIVVGGLFLALLAKTYKGTSYEWLNTSFWNLVMYSITFLALLYIFKYLVIQFIGWVFNAGEQASTYSFIVFLVNKIIGLALLPLLLLLAFSSGHIWDVTVTIAGCVVAFLLLFRYIVSLTIIRSTLSIHPLHFFIYLCAVELMPMFIIYKVLFSYIGNSN